MPRLDRVNERVPKNLLAIHPGSRWIVGDIETAAAPVAQTNNELLVGLRVVSHPSFAPTDSSVTQAGKCELGLVVGVSMEIVSTGKIGPRREPLALRG